MIDPPWWLQSNLGILQIQSLMDAIIALGKVNCSKVYDEPPPLHFDVIAQDSMIITLLDTVSGTQLHSQ